MKILLVMALVLSPSLRAETVTCMAGDPHSGSFSRIQIEPKHSVGSPLGMSYPVATVTSSQRSLAGESLVKRTLKAGYVYYRDAVIPKSFELAIKSREVAGSSLDAVLTLDAGQVYQQRVSGLKCSIDGTPEPAVLACPSPSLANSALIRVARTGSADQIQRMLDCGADVNFRDERGCSALLYVSDLACGSRTSGSNHNPADPGAPESPMGGTRDSFILNELLTVLTDNGAIVDIRESGTNETALIKLAKYGALSGLEVLLGLEANVDAQDQLGNTVLMIAVDRGDEIMMRTILQSGPDLALRNKSGETAYAIAARRGYKELLDDLSPAKMTLMIEGKADGSCSPVSLSLSRGVSAQIVLKAGTKMFRLESPGLGLDLMAMASESAKKTLVPMVSGQFTFTCGVHGAPLDQQTHGIFVVSQ